MRKIICRYKLQTDMFYSLKKSRTVGLNRVLEVEGKESSSIFHFCMQVARHTKPEGHFKVWATIFLLFRGRCHVLLGLKQGYPLNSPYGCRLGYHQSEVWPVEQKALPPQFYVVCHDLEPTLC